MIQLGGRHPLCEAKHSHYCYSILPSIFRMLDQEGGTHLIDCFAEYYNCLVQSGRFNSQFYHPDSEWVNALTTHWGGENNWVHPAYGNLAPVIQHLIYCKADCLSSSLSGREPTGGTSSSPERGLGRISSRKSSI
jgi:hypothetical protein